MTHDAFAEKLLDLAYGELPAREARKVEAHAAACDACRAELARMRETRSLMAALPDEPAPEKGERILFAAAREAAEKRAAPGRLRRSFWAVAAVAASLVAVAGVSFRLGELRSGAKPDSEALLGEPPASKGSPAGPTSVTLQGAESPAAADTGAEREVAAAPAERDTRRERAEAPRAPARAEKKAAPARPEPRGRAFAEAPPPARDDGARRDAAGRGGGDSEGRFAAAPAAPPSGAEAAPPAVASAPPAPPEPRAAAEAPPPVRAVESERLGVRRGAPAGRAAAPGAAEPGASAPRALAAPPRGETRRFEGCEGESFREVRAEQGRVALYVREGRIHGRRVRVTHVYGPDGSLRSATAVDLDAGGPPVDPRTLGVEPVGRAEDAGLDAPPRCGP